MYSFVCFDVVLCSYKHSIVMTYFTMKSNGKFVDFENFLYVKGIIFILNQILELGLTKDSCSNYIFAIYFPSINLKSP